MRNNKNTRIPIMNNQMRANNIGGPSERLNFVLKAMKDTKKKRHQGAINVNCLIVEN
jgi:hypothetical protein